MAKEKWVPMGRRVLDVAYLRDGEITHTGEALALAMLLHAKGSSNRTRNDLEQVGRMLNDPNIDKPKPRRKKK